MSRMISSRFMDSAYSDTVRATSPPNPTYSSGLSCSWPHPLNPARLPLRFRLLRHDLGQSLQLVFPFLQARIEGIEPLMLLNRLAQSFEHFIDRVRHIRSRVQQCFLSFVGFGDGGEIGG